MADSLRLKGAKSVSKHTGTELSLRRPARGGDMFQVPTWWNLKHRVQYTSAAIFKVTTSGRGELALIIPVDPERSEISIKHDGNGGFTFPSVRGVDRVAVMSADLGTFYEEYQFAKISGGPVLKRTVNALPVIESVVFTTASIITGSPVVGETLTATAATYSGGVGSVTTNLIFQVSDTGSGGWSFLSGNPGTGSGGTATYTVQAADAGKYIRCSYQVTDDEATHSSNSSGTGPIAETFSTRVANADLTYTVTVVNTAAEGDPAVNVYALNGTNQQAITMSPGESVAFDFSAVASAHPLGIFTDSSKTTPVTVGVETGGTGNATLLFTPPIAGTFSYQCINHANMGGDITVS